MWLKFDTLGQKLERYYPPILVTFFFAFIGGGLLYIASEDERVFQEQVISGVVVGAHQTVHLSNSPRIVLNVEIPGGERVRVLLPENQATVLGEKVQIKRTETEKRNIHYSFIRSEAPISC